ncbi:hypothetical protein HPHPH18_1084 [Helicobacter pylori Hp H-18]|nr:hypothetical protein HPHPH18_1084 [Helicobacter pylori Hp H-18]
MRLKRKRNYTLTHKLSLFKKRDFKNASSVFVRAFQKP